MNPKKKLGSFVSVVILDRYLDDASDNSKESLLDKIYQQLEQHFIDYEIVIVEEMSSYDWHTILTKIPSIRVINLSFQVDEEVAITVGLDNMIGDYVVLYNPIHDPLNLIVQSVQLCNKNDIVIGIEENPHYGLFYRSIRVLVSWLLKEIGYYLPKNATSFRCLSRTAVNAATRARNCHHQIYVRISQCGLGFIPLVYQSNNNTQNKKTLLSSVNAFFQLLIFNSVKPLRWMSLLGVFGSLCSFIFIFYGLLSKFFNNEVIDGWSSTLIIISFFFSLLFIILAFLGEYMNRLLYEQSRHEPYWVVNEKHSSVMLNETRFNVTDHATEPH